MNKRFAALALAASLLISCNAQSAISGPVTPQSLPNILRDARDGDTITLPPGNYGAVAIQGRRWARPVTIRAGDAVFSAIKIDQVDGLVLDGGTVTAPNSRNAKGVFVSQSSNIALSNLRVSGAVVGIVLQKSQNVTVRGAVLSAMTADGIHIVASRRIVLDGTQCSGFVPDAKIFQNGELVQDARHPDCIQGWSRPDSPPLADVTITNTRVNGNMQGISFFNHSRNGIDDGGFDRVTIKNNSVVTTRPRGIALLGGRNSVVRDNSVRSIPGSALERNGRPVRTGVEVQGSGNLACGNSIPDKPDSPEAMRCPR